MIRCLLMMLLAAPSAAQSLPWIDISGAWLFIAGDDPRYAQPEFDDSGWKPVELPGATLLTRGEEQYFWLRRTIDLPQGLEKDHLALTLGKITENYQVYLNGSLVSGIGNFTVRDSQLARPRTFDLPPINGSRLTIAVRCWRFRYAGGSTSWLNSRDTGPYLLTAASNAPRTAGDAFIAKLRLLRTLDLVTGTALLVLALFPLLIYRYQSSRVELLWLALHAAVVGVRRLQVVLLIAPDLTPWRYSVSLTLVHNAILLEFLLAALSIRARWLRLAIWAPLLLSFVQPNSQYSFQFATMTAISAGIFVWAAIQARERSLANFLILGGCVLVFYAGITVDGLAELVRQRLPPMFLNLGPYGISRHSPLTALFTLAMVLLLTRRLLADSLEKQRLAGELEAARTVQGLLLSRASVAACEFIIDAAYQPAQEVGGDFYFVLDGNVVVVGDVSGKGLKAAMLVSLLIGVLRETEHRSPSAVLAALNRATAGQIEGGFVTCCCACFDADGTVTIANAGHLSPYLNGAEVAVEAGLPLGLAQDVAYSQTTIDINNGTLTILSDGVVEAANDQGELFGFERTREISGKPAAEIAAAAQAWGQNDDITVVTVARKA